MTKTEYIERYGEEAYQKRLERQKERYKNNRDKILEQVKAYRKANKEKVTEYEKTYRQSNKEKIAVRNREYRVTNEEKLKTYRTVNREKIVERLRIYHSTKNGRAKSLLGGYKRNDKKNNRGECTLTSDWIVENIFSGQVCQYCGESDWQKLGCDRIDNDLPHTPDNVVCSCWDCNNKRGDKPYEDFVKECNKQSA